MRDFSPFDDPEFREAHAFGYLINPFYTNVLVLDMDEYNEPAMQFIKDALLECDDIDCMDIAISSFDENNKPKGRHIYLGLKEHRDIMSFYETGLAGTCDGFNRLIVRKGEIVIRISEKFFMGKPAQGTKPRWEEGYTKIGVNKCLHFTSEQLIAPLIIADVQSYVNLKEARRRTLRLRG